MTPRFSCALSTRVVEIDEGKARDYIGDYEYYCWKRSKELEDQIPPEAKLEKKKSKKKQKPEKEKPTTEHITNGATYNTNSCALPPNHLGETSQKASPDWRNKSPQRKKRLPQLEEQIKARDVELAAPETYQDYSRWNTLHQEREKWTRDLDRLTHKWGDLTVQLEKQQSQIS